MSSHLTLVDDAPEGAQSWTSKLRTNRRGDYLPTLGNVLTILARDRRWTAVLAYDTFSEQVVLLGSPPWEPADELTPRPLTEQDEDCFVAWLEAAWGMTCGTSVAARALSLAARSSPVHPVVDYLTTLAWDGTERVAGRNGPGWLTTYLGAADSDYSRAVGKMWLIAAVARVMAPGCKVDTMLILEGPQGAMKSAALRVLAGCWFLDDLRSLGSKDSCQQLLGRWIVELGELAALSAAGVELAKRVVSTQVDNYRAPYGRRAQSIPRQCVFAGTTNRQQYLRDDTGNRRFWPVEIGIIDLEGLARDRDQLWAEAVALHSSGERWWVEAPDLARLIAVEQDLRREHDPLEDRIRRGLEHKCEVTISFVLTFLLKLDETQASSKAMSMRVGSALRNLGWTRTRRRLPGSDDRPYVYVRDPL